MIGKRLRAALDANEWTQDEAARRLGVSRQAFGAVVNERSSVTAEMAFRFELIFGGSAEQWCRWQMAKSLADVRARSKEIRATMVLR